MDFFDHLSVAASVTMPFLPRLFRYAWKCFKWIYNALSVFSGFICFAPLCVRLLPKRDQLCPPDHDENDDGDDDDDVTM